MKILFFVAVFPPEREPAGIMAAELADHWVARGWTASVVCPFPNRPRGEVYQGYSRRPWRHEQRGAVSVHRVWTWLVGPRRTAVGRILENLSFGVASSTFLLLTRRPSVVVAEAWPVLAQAMIVGAARLRRIPVINYIQDAYPEAAVSAGVIRRGSWIEGFLLRLDRWTCSTATKSVVISGGMQGLISRTRLVESNKVAVIENWIDVSRIVPFQGTSKWREENGIDPSEFVCLFAGTLGFASGAVVLVDVAERLQAEPVRLVIIGDGVAGPGIRERVQARSLRNVLLLPFQPADRVSEIQSACDVLLLTTHSQVESSSVPSKLLTYLAVGRPVICAVSEGSDIAKLVRDGEVGWVVSPADVEGLTAAIREAEAKGPEWRHRIGQRARALAESRFSMSRAAGEFDRLLESLTQGGNGGAELQPSD